MIENVINLLPLISILISLYLFHLIKKEQKNSKPIEDRQVLMKKHILTNEENIKYLEEALHELDGGISSWKLRLVSDFKELENKIANLHSRWDIVSDDRITSIPQNNKEWWEAKQIVAQTPQKVWKPKKLSQSKSGFINENVKYNSIEQDEDEINQDFSELSDEDFENILDDDSDDTSSSGSTDHLQQQKPKRKKAPQKTK